ncbi:MAG: hypothetical protein MPL62_17910, partial [Alphaproteobacteria bacterium]|nr:hypothetical protein [Alphaproteobacteria bacterium]
MLPFVDCLHGFPPALLPEGSEDQPHLLGGTYLFPNMTIQCSGRVTAIDFSGYFNPDVRYNSTLRMQVQLYSLTGSQYMLETAINLVLNVDEFSMTQPNLMLDANGRYYVSQPLVVPLTSTLTTPRQVSPEHILGISLPPTESLSLGEVSHGVSIAVLDDSGSPAVTLSNCWN